MIRKFCFAAALTAALLTEAQSTQVATLLHDGEITNFYTGTALQEAYERALPGDVITLSTGNFNAVNISKELTIRGAGMGITNDGESVPGTTISGNIMFDCPEHGDNNLILEGIHFQSNRCWAYHLKNATISKCKFDIFTDYSTDTDWDNLSFTNCIISGISFPNNPLKASINFINCVLEGYINVRDSKQSSYLFDHCVFYTENNGNDFNNSTISNSILSNKCDNNNSTSKGQINNNCTVNNSVITGYSFNLPESNNLFPENADNIFASEGFYEPSESLKEFKTTDGSQVGIHGGSMKFNAVPSVPQITKFNVSSKTTADGKLSVDIEVKSAQ